MKVTLYRAPIEISFSLTNDSNHIKFKREFDSLGEADDDPIGNWVKIAKSQGDNNTDPLLLKLLVEMHRKIDTLQQIIENQQTEHIELSTSIHIQSVGYEYFKLDDGFLLEDDKRYYGRIIMPVFPKRQVAIFFKKHKDNIAKIEIMHDRDNKEWDFYVSSRERAMIREIKSVDNNKSIDYFEDSQK